MAGLVPQEAVLRHSLLSGLPWDTTRIIEYGWSIARQLEWSNICSTVQGANEHPRVVVVVRSSTGSNTPVACRQGLRSLLVDKDYDIRTTNNNLFANDVGVVVLILPPKEPSNAYSWIQFANVLKLWLSCGTQIRRGRNLDRLNEKARCHLQGYMDAFPAFVSQIHDMIPAEPGVLKSSMACLKVGVVHDPERWWHVEQAMEFYNFLRFLVKEVADLEVLKVPKSMQRSAGQPSTSRQRELSGVPKVRDGRVSKRHLKRVKKRKARALERAAQKHFEDLSI
ncbi:hypothetical protein OSTOST_00502 [Ostertagia ostertagi]